MERAGYAHPGPCDQAYSRSDFRGPSFPFLLSDFRSVADFCHRRPARFFCVLFRVFAQKRRRVGVDTVYFSGEHPWMPPQGRIPWLGKPPGRRATEEAAERRRVLRLIKWLKDRYQMSRSPNRRPIWRWLPPRWWSSCSSHRINSWTRRNRVVQAVRRFTHTGTRGSISDSLRHRNVRKV